MSNKILIENVAREIKDLRELYEKEPNNVIHRAISMLDMYLENLSVEEVIYRPFDYGVLKCKKRYPVIDIYDEALNYEMKEIEAEFELKIDEMLSDYEHAYQLEPVTVKEATPYLDLEVLPYIPKEHQMIFKGYKIYKKKVK